MKDVAIIGAGLAGLNCASTLERAGLNVILVEAQDAPGGRIRTDRIDGFLLDRGFQVLLTAYPEAQNAFDYPALDLKPLKPGALVWKGGRFHHFADPFRDPFGALALALDPIVTLGDKLGVAQLRLHTQRGSVADIFSHSESTTRKYLENFGFSPQILTAFFEPFFAGVLLETELATSSRYFEFLFRMFSSGPVAIPAAGMEALPAQLAAKLRPGTLVGNCAIQHMASEATGFTLVAADGRSFTAAQIVVAVREDQAANLLAQAATQPTSTSASAIWNRTTTFYYAASQAPLRQPVLLLNGEGPQAGPVNNAVVMSAVSTSYAPPDRSLISASVVGQAPAGITASNKLEQAVRHHLRQWFGSCVESWNFLRSYPLEYALPLQRTANWESADPRLTSNGLRIENLYQAGDFMETASIQGALASGRRAAEALLRDISR